MADDDQDDTNASEDPTQKRLDEALERGDVVKSQEVNTWFVHRRRHAGAARVLRLDEQRLEHDACAACSPTRITIPVDGRGLDRAHRAARLRGARRGRAAAPGAGARRDRRQHDPAPAGVVGRAAQAEVLEDFADRRLEAAVLQAGARQFRQGPGQARGDRRGDAVAAAVAGAPPARQAWCETDIRRHACR